MVSNLISASAGQLAHELIAECCASPNPLQVDLVRLATAELRHRRDLGVLKGSVRLAAVSSASLYVRTLLPANAELVGTEVPLGGRVADVVWTVDGTWFVDEIKTGLWPSSSHQESQCSELLAGGTAMWGSAFAGVRLVCTSRPSLSRWYLAADASAPRLVTFDGAELVTS